jgi:hypothetical protein
MLAEDRNAAVARGSDGSKSTADFEDDVWEGEVSNNSVGKTPLQMLFANARQNWSVAA